MDKLPPAGVFVFAGMAAGAVLLVAWHGDSPWGWTLVIVSPLAYWRTWAFIRWWLALPGLFLIRAYVTRKARPYRAELGPPGKVTDPDAPWRRWLESRCSSCGH